MPVQLVYRASLKHAKELIADHSLSHARETEDLLDLVLSEQRRNMSVNVTHLLGRIRRLTRDETSFEDVMNQPIFGTEVDAGVEGDGGRPSELALASAAIMPAPGDHSLLGHDHDHDHDHDRQDITLDPMSEFAASFAEQHDFVAAGHDEEDGPMGVDELLEEPPLDTTATAAAAAATTPAAAHPFLEQQEPPVVKRWPGLDQCVL
ncbi:hypothetical protein KEM52_005642 [Ascosphaera acerosa]|nr:hypothetical protein KEM52_005642 [Ascosphaera acerosa]